jgi:hypothetical protein
VAESTGTIGGPDLLWSYRQTLRLLISFRLHGY